MKRKLFLLFSSLAIAGNMAIAGFNVAYQPLGPLAFDHFPEGTVIKDWVVVDAISLQPVMDKYSFAGLPFFPSSANDKTGFVTGNITDGRKQFEISFSGPIKFIYTGPNKNYWMYKNYKFEKAHEVVAEPKKFD